MVTKSQGTQGLSEELAAELANDPKAAARPEAVGEEAVKPRKSELARVDNLADPPKIDSEIVYGVCDMCTNKAPHRGPDKVMCPRCGLQLARLAD